MNNLIYICDDNEELLEVICKLLEKKNYECVNFETAGEMIDKLHNTRPLCIFLDYYLKDMSAEEAIDQIRKLNIKTSPPVILCSGAQNCAELCAQLKAHDYLQKPFDMPQLLAKIKAIEISDAAS